MSDAGELIERLCVAAGMIMEDTAEAALIAPATASTDQRLGLLLDAGYDVAALASAALVIQRRYGGTVA